MIPPGKLLPSQRALTSWSTSNCEETHEESPGLETCSSCFLARKPGSHSNDGSLGRCTLLPPKGRSPLPSSVAAGQRKEESRAWVKSIVTFLFPSWCPLSQLPVRASERACGHMVSSDLPARDCWEGFCSLWRASWCSLFSAL